MKKSSILLCTIALGAFSAGASVLTPEQALARLNATHRVPAATEVAAPVLLYTQTGDLEPVCYVFSRGDGAEGFMVLSADDMAAPVLGYSDTGKFDSADIPANMQWWLGEYAREIEYARANGISYAPAQAADSRQPIAPMMSTLWNQDAPYNDMCPTNTAGRRTYTGCVATAMAQMMKYHNYPEVGRDKKSYTLNIDGSSTPTTLTIDYSQEHFDWNNMLNFYASGNSTSAQRQAVAHLMYCAGVSVNMGYGTSSSGAQSARIAGALVTYFNYDKGCHMIDRDYVPYNEWVDMVYQELKTVGPVVYGGQSRDGGHAFVCDGYDTNGYFHINWGWGGMSDGYFRLTALDPDSQGIGGASAGFNSGQHALFGAQRPKADSKYYYSFTCGGNFTLDKNETTLGKTLKVTSTGTSNNDKLFWNSSSWVVTGTLGLCIISSNGNERYVGGVAVSNVQQNSAYSEYSVNLPTDLANGTYTVVPAWKSNDGTMRRMLVRIPCVKAYKMVVADKKVTLTPIEPDPKVSVTSLEALTPVYAGKRAKFEVTFSNSTADEFYNEVAAGLFKAGTSDYTAPAYAGASMIVDVVGNESATVDYLARFGTAPAGDYVLYFYEPGTYRRLGQGYNVTVQAAPKNNTVEVHDFRLSGNKTEVADPDNLVFEFDATCTSGLFDGTLTIGIIQGNQTYWRSNFQTQPIFLFEGESESLSVLGSFARAQYGQTYNAYLYEGNNKSSAKELAGPVTFKVVDPSGISDIEADGTEGEAIYYNMQGIAVQGELSPGYYIKVVDGKAEHFVKK